MTCCRSSGRRRASSPPAPQRERENFDLWIRQEHMIAVPGPTIRFSLDCGGDRAARRPNSIFERSLMTDGGSTISSRISTDADCPVPLEPRGQGFKDAGPDISVLIELALLAGCATAAIRSCGGHVGRHRGRGPGRQFEGGQGRVESAADRSRIDPAVALAMALGLATRTPPPRRSVYEDRGPIFLVP